MEFVSVRHWDLLIAHALAFLFVFIYFIACAIEIKLNETHNCRFVLCQLFPLCLPKKQISILVLPKKRRQGCDITQYSLFIEFFSYQKVFGQHNKNWFIFNWKPNKIYFFLVWNARKCNFSYILLTRTKNIISFVLKKFHFD